MSTSYSTKSKKNRTEELSELMPQNIDAEEAVISVVANSPYGHPAPATLERLEDYGCIIRRTDLEGPVLYELG